MIDKDIKFMLKGFAMNIAAAGIKLVAAVISGSSSLVASSLQSFSDAFNRMSFFRAVKRSSKPGYRKHELGEVKFTKDAFIRPIFKSMLFSGIAGMLAILYFVNISHKIFLKNPFAAFIGLGLAFCLDGYLLSESYFDIRKYMRQENIKSFWHALRHYKNVMTLTAFFEDLLAVLGSIIVACAILLSAITGNMLFDRLATLIIGLLLLGFTLVLISIIKNVILNEEVTDRTKQRIENIILSFKETKEIISLRMIRLPSEELVVAAEVYFDQKLGMRELEKVTGQMTARIREFLPHTQASIEAVDKKAKRH